MDFFFFHAQETAWISGLSDDCRSELQYVFMSEFKQICSWLGLLTLRDCSKCFRQGNDVQGQLNLGRKFPPAGSPSASCQSIIKTVITTCPCSCHICPECGRNLQELSYHFHPFAMFVAVTYLWHAEQIYRRLNLLTFFAIHFSKLRTGICDLAASDAAFAALREDGEVIAWGNPHFGHWDLVKFGQGLGFPCCIGRLNNIQKITGITGRQLVMLHS